MPQGPLPCLLETTVDSSHVRCARLPPSAGQRLQCPVVDSTKVPLGVLTDVYDKYVDPDNVVAYALASNDDNPLYLSGEAVPPVFAVAVAWNAFINNPPLPPEAVHGQRGGVHGTHDLYIRKQMVPGSWLHTTGERSSVICSKAGMNVVTKLVSTDDDGDVVLEQYWSSLMRGEVTGGDQGTPVADHSFGDDVRANLVGSVSLPTTRDQTFRYAGASGDRSPMHFDDEVARAMGFPKKFNQGLCTLAVTSRGLIELAASGDPRRVRRIAVRFTSPSYPGEAIGLSVYDANGGDDGNQVFAFEAVCGDQFTLRHGLVEVSRS
jgi:acyl dehydratase